MAEGNRRSFLKWATHGLGVMFAAIIGVPAIAYLADGRNRTAAARGFRPVDGINLQDLAQGDVKQGVIRSIRRDAWTLHPNDVIGRVWVIKHGAGPRDLRVFTTICPHLGCSINHNPDNSGFTCPCHGGKFGPNGELQGQHNPAPRGMDELQWKPDETNPAVLLVDYKNYRQGQHERVEKT